MEKLVRTWLNKDKQWFDKEAVFDILKDDIIAMLDSKNSSKKNTDFREYNIRPLFHLHLSFSHPYDITTAIYV